MKIVQIGNATLIHADCFDAMATLPDKSVDLVLCDLPYGTTRNKWDSVLPLESLWQSYWRVCSGAVVLTAQTPFDKILGVSCISHLRYEWIWEKTSATGHLNSKIAPMKAHENVLVFYQKRPKYNPQKTFGHQRKTAVAVRSRLQSECYGDQRGVTAYDSTERYPRSVQVFSSDKQRSCIHPTQKPVALMEYMILTYTDEGDTVLDNCMGSGTTGVAAANTGRKFIGIEKDEGYFKIACDRIAKAQGL